MSRFLKHSLTSSSSTKGASSLLWTFSWFLGSPASFNPRPLWFPPLSFVTWVLGEAFLVSDILGWIQFQLGFGFPDFIPACWENFPVFLPGYLSLLPPSMGFLSAFVFGAPGSSLLPCWHFSLAQDAC